MLLTGVACKTENVEKVDIKANAHTRCEVGVM